MRGRVVEVTLLTTWAVAVGHLTWQACVGPSFRPDYVVGGRMLTFEGTDPDAKSLYLRRQVFLSRRPRAAWLQVIGRDEIHLYVNGRFVAEEVRNGFPVAVVADLAEYLDVGVNVIAIASRQASIGLPPAVAVEGGYSLSDGEHPLGPEGIWRCRSVFERTGSWWFDPMFQDRHWPRARAHWATHRAVSDLPPRSVKVPDSGAWLTPVSWEEGAAAVRYDFEIPWRPGSAWLRVTATSSYRLSLNGILIDTQEDQAGTTAPVPLVRRTYDVTSVVRPGMNRVALLLSSRAGPPHLRVDAEVEDGSGRRIGLRSDGGWSGRPGFAADWLEDWPATSPGWQPCIVESGDLDHPPWAPSRQSVEVVLPWDESIRRASGQLALMALVGVVTAAMARPVTRALGRGRRPGAPDRLRTRLALLPLVPATVAIGFGFLATFDPRVTPQSIYRPEYLVVALASVPVQWAWLWLCRAPSRQPDRSTSPGVPARWPGSRGSMVALIVPMSLVGAWLRLRDLAAEPLHTDEVTVLRSALGLLERGFPSLRIAEGLPVYYISGCELEGIGAALASLFLGDDRYVSRLPAVLWSVATIPLIFFVTRRAFGLLAGAIAAGLYTLAATPIQMANFGRYPAQLQFFTLLTAHFYRETIRGTGPVDRRYLAATTASFLTMFLSWEASAMVAPGMVLAAVVERRGRVRALLTDPGIWIAVLAVSTVVLVQFSHGMWQQAKFLIVGTGWGDVKITPMWNFSIFNPFRPVGEAGWSQDALLPAAGLASAVFLAARRSRLPFRFFLLILLANCFALACFLPLMAPRYSYHLIPFTIILAAGACSVGVRALDEPAARARVSVGLKAYSGVVALMPALALVGLGNGVALQFTEMTGLRFEGWLLQPGVYKLVNMGGPARFLHDHLRQGDLVLATHPDVVDHYLAIYHGGPIRVERRTDYWVQSTLEYPAVLGEHSPRPLHRFSGTPMIASRDDLEELFARYPRAWFVVQPSRHSQINAEDVSEFLRQNMEVAYEDFQSKVLFRGGNSRPAGRRELDDRALDDANANYLP